MVLRSLQPRIARHVVGDVKGKKPFGRQRLVDVSTIISTSQRLLRRHQPAPQLPGTHHSYAPHQYRPRETRQPCYAAQFAVRPTTPYPRPRAQQTSTLFALRMQRQFSQLEAGLLIAFTPRPPPQPISP
ncbi:hypothetical protein AAG906_002183 [Vitis piasezkii]